MDINQYSSVSLKNKYQARALLLGLFLMWLGVSGIKGQVYSGKSNSLDVSIVDEVVTNKSTKPIITWIYPAETTEFINKAEVNLKMGISSKTAVVKVTLMVNNEVIEVFQNFSQTDPGYLFDAWLEKEVQLIQGSNDIMLIVQNEQGSLKHQRKVEVSTLASLRQDHALVFAIDEYDSWEDLTGPVRDAERIARVLEEKGYDLEIVRNVTTFDLLAKLEEYVVKEFDPQDQLLIYFAGHGSIDDATGEGYLVCKNSLNLRNEHSTYIAYDVIKSIVNNIPAQHILMVMDAVKGHGQMLTSLFEQAEPPPTEDEGISPQVRTRIAILSGSPKYMQGPAYNAGSYLSKAFTTYLRKSEQTAYPSWGDLLKEFKDVDPTPLYLEFGDHSPDNKFIFKQEEVTNK